MVEIGTCGISNEFMLMHKYQDKDLIMDHFRLQPQLLAPSGRQMADQGPELGHKRDPTPATPVVTLKLILV